MTKYKILYKTIFILSVFLFVFLVLPKQALAVTCPSAGTGDWNNTGTWTGCTGGNGTTANTPGSNDTAIITSNHTVTLTGNETVNALQFNGAATAAILSINSGITLAVTTSVTVLGNLGAATSATIQDGSGAGIITAASLTVGITGTSTLNSSVATLFTSTVSTFTISGAVSTNCQTNGAGNRKNQTTINLSSGSMSVTGTITLCGTGQGALFQMNQESQNATLTTSAATPWSITAPGAATLNGTGATVNYSGAAQPILVVNYTNLTLSGSGTATGAVTSVTGALSMSGSVAWTQDAITSTISSVTLNGTSSLTTGANMTISGNLTVGSGTTFTTGANFTLAVTGTTSVSGTLANSNTGTKTYTGAVTINSGGSFTNANNSSLTFQGGLTNNSSGTVSFGTTGTTVTFSTNTQAIAGSQSITFGATVAITGAITVTNNNNSTVTVSGDLTGSAGGSTWQQGTNSTTLFAGAVLATGTLDASTNTPNTVEYSANGTQTIKAPSSSYWHLTLSGTGTSTKTAGAALTVNGTFTIGGNSTFAGGTSLTHNFGGSWVVNTTAASSPYSFTTSGTVNFNTPGTPAATSITGSSSQTIAFNVLNINNTSGFSISNNISASGNLTVANSVTFTPGATNTISGTGTLTGNGTVKVTKISATNDFLLQYSISNLTLTNLTVDYAGVNQGFSDTTYGNVLISANSIQTGAGTGTIGGTFTVGASGVFTPSSGTTTFNSGASISNSGTLTFASITIASGATVTTSSSFTINGTLTNSSTATFEPSGGTITMATTGWSIVNSGTSLKFNNLTISETPTIQPTSSFSVNGTLNVNSTKTLSPTAGTITMTGGSIANNGGAAANLEFFNLTISASVTANSQSFNIKGDTSITGTLTVSSGSGTITAKGDVTGTGTVSLTSGTFIQSVAAGKQFGPTSTNDWTFNNLTFSSSTGSQTITTTTTSTGKVVIGATLTLSANTTLDAGNRTWNLTATGTPFSISGTPTPKTSTFNYHGSSSGVTVTGASYYNLGVGTNANGTATLFTLGGDTTVGNVLTIGDAASSANDTLDCSTRTLTLSGTGTPFNRTAFGLFTASSSTVNYTGTSAGVNISAETYYNLGAGTTGDANTVAYTLAGNTIVGSVLTVGAASGAGPHSLDGSNRTLTLSATGTPFVINTQGTYTPSTSTVIYSGTSAPVNVAGASYYNLEVGTTGDGNTATYTLSADTTASRVLTIGASSGAGIHSLDGSTRTLTLSGTTGSPLSIGSQGAFTASSSTVNYTGNNTGGDTTINATPAYFNLGLGGGSAENYIPSTSLSISNDLTMNANGTLIGTNSVTVNGSVTGSGTITLTGGTFEQRVAAADNFGTTGGSNPWSFVTLLFSNSSGADRTITTQTGGSGTITVSTLLQVGKALDSNQTILDAGNRTWTLSGTNGTPFDIVSPSSSTSLTANSSTFSYTGANGSGDTTIQSATYNNLTLNASDIFVPEASPLNINGDLTVTTGTLSMTTNDLNVGSSGIASSGDISVAGSLTQSASGTTTVKTSTGGVASIGGAGTVTFYNLTIAPAVAAEPTITLGTGASQTITVSNDLTIGNGTNAVTVTAASNNPALDINGSVSISASGTLTAPGSTGSFNVAVNFTNNGTFNHNSGTVTFDTTATSILNGSGSPAITFSGIAFPTAAKIVQFTAGKTFRINGLFTVTGSAGNLIRLNSTSAGSQWTINHQGTESISYARVQDSACDGTSTQITLDTMSVDAGNN